MFLPLYDTENVMSTLMGDKKAVRFLFVYIYILYLYIISFCYLSSFSFHCDISLILITNFFLFLWGFFLFLKFYFDICHLLGVEKYGRQLFQIHGSKILAQLELQ